MSLKLAIKKLRNELLQYGYEIQTNNWQGIENPPVFLEILNASFESQMPNTKDKAILECNPTPLAWALEHFDERVSGLPLNPPPSAVNWLKGNEASLEANGKFSHSYPERMYKTIFQAADLLKKDPTTRQCFVPMWLPEDNEMALENRRVPCSLGWHFILRDKELHCFYSLRSCDALRHFHNDVFFATLLTQWIIEKSGIDAIPGNLTFHAVSFHCFSNDKYALERAVK